MAKPSVTLPIIKELPPEIWKKILSNLDEPELITCRSVNRCLKDLSNEVLREKTSLWKPTFGTVQELVSGKRGIRFSTPDQITRFINEMGGKPNPLPNGTVIFIPDRKLHRGHQVEFQTEICKFLDVFNHDISHLVYVFNLGAIQNKMDLFNQFRCILELKNLRSLVIDKYGSWDELFWYKSIRNQMSEMLALKKEVLPKLTDLQIYGLSGSIMLSYMFGGMESILKSVSSLDVSNNCHGDDSFPLYPFPSLNKLKVRSPNAQFLKQLQQFKPNSGASLKEVSLFFESKFYMGRGLTIDLDLEEICTLLDIHAETLEFLHLDFGYDWGWIKRLVGPTRLDTSIKYTNLKRLALQYDNFNCWEAEMKEIVKKCVNLQEFHVLGNISAAVDPNHPNRPREEYEMVQQFWKVLPATVEVIHVPVYGWKIKRGDHFQEERNEDEVWEINEDEDWDYPNGM